MLGEFCRSPIQSYEIRTSHDLWVEHRVYIYMYIIIKLMKISRTYELHLPQTAQNRSNTECSLHPKGHACCHHQLLPRLSLPCCALVGFTSINSETFPCVSLRVSIMLCDQAYKRPLDNRYGQCLRKLEPAMWTVAMRVRFPGG